MVVSPGMGREVRVRVPSLGNMDKCPYKTVEYCYGFTCIRCHCVWFYPHDVDPMVCAKCEEEIELDIALEAARKRMELVRVERERLRKYSQDYNLRLKELYYGPLEAQLNEKTPFIKVGHPEETKDLFKQEYPTAKGYEPRKPQPIKRNKFWKR